MIQIILTVVFFGCSQFVSATYEECEVIDDTLFNGGYLIPIDWNMNGGIMIVAMSPDHEADAATLAYPYQESIIKKIYFLLEQICGSDRFTLRGANDVLPMPYNATDLNGIPCLFERSVDRRAEHQQYYLCPGRYCTDVLYLECLEEDDTTDWQLKEAGLYRAHGDRIFQDDAEGLLVVDLASTGTNEKVSAATVCDDNFNDHAADLACQYFGFNYAVEWGSSPKNTEYIPNSFLEDEDTVVDFTCYGDERNITDCRARPVLDCSRSQNVWLKCDADYSDWEFIGARLLRYNEESGAVIENASEGLVLVKFSNGRNGNDYSDKMGTVCDDGWNDHAAKLACQYLGYDFARDWGSDPQNEKFLPSRIIDLYQLEILVDDIHCDSSVDHIEQCEARVSDEHDCEISENLWLSCGNNDDGDDYEDGDEENVAEVKLGGAKASLNLNKFQKKRLFE